MSNAKIEDLIGQTFHTVKGYENGEELRFIGEKEYLFYHDYSCCESVSIVDICGDLEDLEGSPILQAEESSGNIGDADDSGTWTFYRFSTFKGAVTVRWHGLSNGYYSESVDFREIK